MRFLDVGNVRGPSRRILAVVTSTGPTLVTLDCGHVVERVNHHHYIVGDWSRCFTCQRVAAGICALVGALIEAWQREFFRLTTEPGAALEFSRKVK